MWSKPLRLTLLILVVCFEINGQRLSGIEDVFAEKRYEKVIDMADSLLANTSEIYHPRLFQLRADAQYFLGDLEASIESYFKAINSGESAEVRDEVLLLECYSHAGFCYREMGLNQHAFPHYKQSLLIAKKIGDSVEMATQYYNIGTLYQYLGDFESSIKLLDSAYQIDVARRDTVSIGFDLGLLAELKFHTGEQKEALYYAKESLSLLKPGTANLNSYATRLNLVGDYFLEMDQLDSASDYLLKAESEFEQIEDKWRLASCWLDLAKLKIKQKKLPEAVELAQQAHAFFEQKGDSQFFIVSNNIMAQAYGEMQLISKALDILIENELKCKNLGILKSLKENYALQSEVYLKLGDSEKAEMMKQKHKSLNDSLTALSNREQLNRLALQVKFDKLEQENQILSERHAETTSALADKSVRMTWLTWGGLGIFILMLLIIYLIRRNLKLKNLALEGEVEELRQQIKVLLEGDTSELEVDLSKINQCLNAPLTDREFEILGYAIGDLNNSQIAEKVFLSVNTVKYHLKNIYEKLGVSNRKQALEYVVRTK